MANPCVGVTFTWNGVAFQEVQEYRYIGPGSPAIGRADAWKLDRGTIEIVCLGGANVGTQFYGKRYPLVVATSSTPNAGLTLNVDCVYEDFAIESVVNDVTRYRVTFKVMDTIGAGSVPA